MKLPISVIILTFNEENNITKCLESVCDFFDEIVIIDSGSTDKTLEIASKFGVNVLNHPFENYAKQRNWALKTIEYKNKWVFNLDADQEIEKELISELSTFFSSPDLIDFNGFMISRKTIFMDKWIKHGGHYPTYHAALFKLNFGSCEEKNYDQHFIVEGKTKILKNNIIDTITDSLTNFTSRHNHWATLEATEAVSNFDFNIKLIKANINGNPMEKRRYLKMKYYQYPIFLRVFIYFIIRYIFRLGFLDGKTGLIFHFLQGFWFRFLVDAKIYELRKNAKSKNL